MAPELFQYNSTAKSRMQSHPSRDIYAFGCTILEVNSLRYALEKQSMTYFQISTERPPFDTYPGAVVINAIVRGERPSRPPEITSDTLWNFVTRCWGTDPGQRPLSKDIVSFLRTLDDSNAITHFAHAAQDNSVPGTEVSNVFESAWSSFADSSLAPSTLTTITQPLRNIERPAPAVTQAPIVSLPANPPPLRVTQPPVSSPAVPIVSLPDNPPLSQPPASGRAESPSGKNTVERVNKEADRFIRRVGRELRRW